MPKKQPPRVAPYRPWEAYLAESPQDRVRVVGRNAEEAAQNFVRRFSPSEVRFEVLVTAIDTVHRQTLQVWVDWLPRALAKAIYL